MAVTHTYAPDRDTVSCCVHFLDVFLIFTLLAAAAALLTLGILAFLALKPFQERNMATGIVFCIIASGCVLSMAGYVIYIGTRHRRVVYINNRVDGYTSRTIDRMA